MKILYFTLLGLVLVPAVYSQLPANKYDLGKVTSNAQESSIITLLVNPSVYDGKVVRVVGFFTGSYGGSYVFLTKDHAKLHDVTNAIIVASKFEDKFVPDQFQGRYIMLEGVCTYDARTQKCYISTITRIAIRPTIEIE